jgi:hypothetical protein
MSTQAERINAAGAALAATVVVGQLHTSFPLGKDASRFSRALSAGTSWAPLLFLKPEKRGTGVMSFLSDPRVWSFALVEGIVAAKEIAEKFNVTATFAIGRNIPELDKGRRLQLQLADGSDPNKVVWESDNDNVLTVDKNSGVVTAVGDGGSATITAKAADGHEDSVVVRVR